MTTSSQDVQRVTGQKSQGGPPVAVAHFMNAAGARVAATVVSCLAIVVAFLWMPYYPTGSIVLIALDVAVIWAVATWNTSHGSA
jgi:hypothetical protein